MTWFGPLSKTVKFIIVLLFAHLPGTGVTPGRELEHFTKTMNDDPTQKGTNMC